MSGNTTIVIGLQYGDEGKARFVDQLANENDIVARFNGGANAGHTVVANGKKFALRQVPAGVLHPEKKLYIGSGCVVNIVKLFQEIGSLEQVNIEVSSRLKIAARAGVIQPHHILMDKILSGSVGTTGNGIGPAYADRCIRSWQGRTVAINIAMLVNETETSLQIMRDQLTEFGSLFNVEIESYAPEISKIEQHITSLKPLVEANPLYMTNQAKKGDKILFEGAQAVMLDVCQGTTPFVTSSQTIAAAAYTGGDLPPNFHGKTIGIAKAIMSRVGFGPFVSEFGGQESEKYCMSFTEEGKPKFDRDYENKLPLEELLKSNDEFELSKAIRNFSGEYGTVTGRPRRIGALDLVQLKYAIQTNGVDEFILTKCDLLSLFSKTASGKIPLITAYEIDGKQVTSMPATATELRKAKPITTYFDGFTEDISEIRNSEAIPHNLKLLLSSIEDFVECKLAGIGVGPDREQFVSF